MSRRTDWRADHPESFVAVRVGKVEPMSTAVNCRSGGVRRGMDSSTLEGMTNRVSADALLKLGLERK